MTATNVDKDEPRPASIPQGGWFTRIPWPALTLPCLVAAVLIIGWDIAVRLWASDIFPGPLAVVKGIAELISKGLLFKYIVASLYRVTWGFFLAVIIGVPHSAYRKLAIPSGVELIDVWGVC